MSCFTPYSRYWSWLWSSLSCSSSSSSALISSSMQLQNIICSVSRTDSEYLRLLCPFNLDEPKKLCCVTLDHPVKLRSFCGLTSSWGCLFGPL
ncbi:hypothetical protein PPACK8108_LOCUS23961 [Phakopsora pachyrhizi]|uniref:Secreted protein n=1 Tax=Phakopsora pachyrhizi TaxID=170000 RepID=A0AAV0BPG1_PHAPC|nr:hypothetical protein PPACK8108_LOCUS23961 [Phakopsora pachyrhizi]